MLKKYKCIKEDLRFTDEVENTLLERFNIQRTAFEGQYVNPEYSIFISIASYYRDLGYNIYVSLHHSQERQEDVDCDKVFNLYKEVLEYVKGLN